MLVDSYTYQVRLNTCRACPHHYLWLGKLRCRICGCFMGVKVKIASMRCPKNYW